MLGRLPKIRRRPSGAVPAGPEGPVTAALGGLSAPAGPAQPHAAGDTAGAVPPAGVEQPTAVLPVASEPDAGAQAAPPVPVSPGFRDRGKLRRRLRYLRRVRELGYRDLGGLTFDLHRFGRDGAPLVQEKLAALGAVDAELRAVERALGEERAFVDLREAGIAACPRCAALHGSEARFCPSCGIALVGPMAGVVSASPAGLVAEPPVPPAPLWGPAGPSPAQGGGPVPAAGAPVGGVPPGGVPAAGAPAAGVPATGAPATAAVFPGPVSPVPAEQPTQAIPAGAEPPPAPAGVGAGGPVAPLRPAAPHHGEDAGAPPAGVSLRADQAAGASPPAEPAAVTGGSVAAPEPRDPRS